jgi:hypothetical protein
MTGWQHTGQRGCAASQPRALRGCKPWHQAMVAHARHTHPRKIIQVLLFRHAGSSVNDGRAGPTHSD